MHIFGFLRKRQERDLESLLHMLAEGEAVEDLGDFRQICSTFTTGQVCLENMLYESLGMSGEEVMAVLGKEKRFAAHQKHSLIY